MSHILRPEPSNRQSEIGDPVVADIFRFDPQVDSEPRMQRFIVPYRHRMSILTLLREIYETIDSSIAFRNQQCGRGICGTCHCRVGVDGKPVKGCKTILQPGSQVTIRPYIEKKVIRDLVIDQ